MNWKEFTSALCTIFENMLRDCVKKVVLLEGPRPMVQGGALGLLNPTAAIGVGVDETRIVEAAGLPAGEELLPSQCGNRLVTMQFRVEHPHQLDPFAARNAVERARTRIRRISVKSALLAAGVSLATIGPMQDVSFNFDGERFSAATADFIFNAVANERDEAITFIEHVELSTDIKDPGGTSYPAVLQLDEEII